MKRAQVIITSCSRRGLELEQVKDFLRGNDYVLARDDWTVDPAADLILLSTCGFTQAAEDFGLETLRRIQATKKPSAEVVVGGCLPEINPERLAREFDGPTFSPQSYPNLDEIIDAQHRFQEFGRPNTFSNGSTLIRDVRKAVEILKTFDGSLSGLEYVSQRLSNGFHRRMIRARHANLNNRKTYYIQIQEGCSMRCSYCVIRKAIGPLRSKAPGAVLDELESGLRQGFQHFQLMGDNAGSYGLDIGTTLGDLLEQVVTMESGTDGGRAFDLDLTDINPVYLSMVFDPVMELLTLGRLSRLYIPIQSSSRRVLKLMNRDCDMEAVQQMLVEIRQAANRRAPAFKLGTSLIVGFPSETSQEVDDTIQYCREVGFDWVWCHSFSARPETPAARLPDQIPAEEILNRAHRVKSQVQGMRTEDVRSLVITAEDTAGSRTCQG